MRSLIKKSVSTICVLAFLFTFTNTFAQEAVPQTPEIPVEETVSPAEIGVVPTFGQEIKEKELEEQQNLLNEMFGGVALGNTEAVEDMMDEGRVDYYRYNEDGETALTQAIKNNDIEMTQLLVKEAIINLKNEEGETPLTLAIKMQNKDIIPLVMKRAKASLKNDLGEAPLFLALANKDLHLLQHLIRNGADVNRHSNGITPLAQAVELDNYRAVGYLLRNSATPNLPNDNGDIPLYLAIKNERDVIAGILINKSQDAFTDVNWFNAIGDPLVNIAAANGNTELIRMLVEAGASVNELDHEENTPLHIAAANGNDKAVTLLMTYESDINFRNLKGATPLMLAAMNGQNGTYNMLMEYGASEKTKDYLGYTPAEYLANPSLRIETQDNVVAND